LGADNTAKKTAKPSPRSGVSLPLGNHPGNTGGKKGRSGRRPDWLKDWCDDLLADATCKRQVKQILQDKTHPAFKAMWSAVADRAHGKPKEHVTLDVNTDVATALEAARQRAKNR
jgi:hypothetical protein